MRQRSVRGNRISDQETHGTASQGLRVETQAAAREGIRLALHTGRRDADLNAAVKDSFTTPSRTQMPRHINDGDSLSSSSQECSLQPGCPLIVEEVLIPMFFDEFRNDYG